MVVDYYDLYERAYNLQHGNPDPRGDNTLDILVELLSRLQYPPEGV